MIALFNTIVSAVTTAARAVATLAKRYVNNVLEFYSHGERFTVNAAKGEFGASGYFLLALMAASIVFVGIVPVMISLLKGALLFATLLFLIDCYALFVAYQEQNAATPAAV